MLHGWQVLRVSRPFRKSGKLMWRLKRRNGVGSAKLD